MQPGSLCEAPLPRERDAQLGGGDLREAQAEAPAELGEAARRRIGVRDEDRTTSEPLSSSR